MLLVQKLSLIKEDDLGFCTTWVGNYFPTFRKKLPLLSSGIWMRELAHNLDDESRTLYRNVWKEAPNHMAQQSEDLIPQQPVGKLRSEFSLCWEYIYFWFIQLYHLLCFVDASLIFLWKNGTINFHNTWMSASIYTQPYYFKNQLLRSACRQIYISQYKRGISFQIA